MWHTPARLVIDSEALVAVEVRVRSCEGSYVWVMVKTKDFSELFLVAKTDLFKTGDFTSELKKCWVIG